MGQVGICVGSVRGRPAAVCDGARRAAPREPSRAFSRVPRVDVCISFSRVCLWGAEGWLSAMRVLLPVDDGVQSRGAHE